MSRDSGEIGRYGVRASVCKVLAECLQLFLCLPYTDSSTVSLIRQAGQLAVPAFAGERDSVQQFDYREWVYPRTRGGTLVAALMATRY